MKSTITSIATLKEAIESTRNSLATDRMDMSFGEIMSMYEKDEIIVNPDFQRLFRWSDYQKSRFIETILLGIPIPPIFVTEDEDGRWELVDGLQRVSTVLSFFGILKSMPERNGWALLEGDLVPGLNGYECSQLPMRFQLNIKRSACRIEIIRSNSNCDMRFELFNRLNTGGSPLTNMEIRNCIYRGTSARFNDFLKELADLNEFIELISPSKKQKDELYLEELVLRFLSLYNNKANIKNSTNQHMTWFMKESVANKSFPYDSLKKIFIETTNTLLKTLGPSVFRSNNDDFSTGLYDVIVIGVAEHLEKIKQLDEGQLKNIIEKKIKNSSKVKKMSGRGAASKERVLNRFKIANEVFGRL
ncbi:MAG: DUF262 domain-containing protein [Gammaproteobacteria bacterium]|nr:DUF262 domain-containing protein [Gammaproteobacteria bacterium]